MAVTIIRKKLELDEIKNRQMFLLKTQLRCSGRFRWNILIIILIIGFLVMPFFLPIIAVLVINMHFLLFWFAFCIINIVRHFKVCEKVKKYSEQRNNLKTVSAKVDIAYKYIMTTFVYKEPLEMIVKSLKNVSSLNGHENLIIGVCLEERTPELEAKIEHLSTHFGTVYDELIITVHPYGIEGEIPGKCSNSNYGFRSIYNFLKENNPNLLPESYIVVNFDVDTVFHKSFLDILKETVNKEKNPHKTVWQPLLYYNWNLDKLSFFTRIIGILRSKMISAALITFNINVMSVFCASLKLYVDGNFVHPFYQMDDIICFIRWMIVSKNRLQIKPVYSPTISGPTSGKNFIDEFKELWIQSVRWTIGSAEVFHYFMCKLRRISFYDALIWGFNYINYYVGILCIQSLFSISSTLRLAIMNEKINILYTYLFLIPPLMLYMFMGLMILINKLAVKSFLKDLKVNENINVFREIAHWILSVPTTMLYSLITLYAFVSILIFGKEVCKHRTSKKDNLVL